MTNKVGSIGRRWLIEGAVIAGAVTVFVASAQGALAAGPPSQPTTISTASGAVSSGAGAPAAPAGTLQLTSKQMALVHQKFGFLATKGLWGEFTGVNGVLALKGPVATLQAEQHLTAVQVQSIQSILADYRQDVAAAASSASAVPAGAPTPDLSTRGTVIYFTYDDVLNFLYGAALAGPWAIAAAITAVASIMGGPIGTVIGIIVSIIGGATIANLAYLILQAVSQYQGIYFGITWNWIWPNWTEGTWCGCS